MKLVRGVCACGNVGGGQRIDENNTKFELHTRRTKGD